jgi:hypothetical protein
MTLFQMSARRKPPMGHEKPLRSVSQRLFLIVWLKALRKQGQAERIGEGVIRLCEMVTVERNKALTVSSCRVSFTYKVQSVSPALTGSPVRTCIADSLNEAHFRMKCSRFAIESFSASAFHACTTVRSLSYSASRFSGLMSYTTPFGCARTLFKKGTL